MGIQALRRPDLQVRRTINGRGGDTFRARFVCGTVAFGNLFCAAPLRWRPCLPVLKAGWMMSGLGMSRGVTMSLKAMSLKNQAVSPVFAEHRADLDQLCRRYHVARLEVFGSAAVGQDEPTRSDLDFLVEFSSVPSGTYADNYFALLEGLQELFRRPVDLVSITAIKNRYFCESIERTKKLIYAA